MARVKNYEREEAERKDVARARAEKAASKAKTKNKTSKRKVGKDKEPSYEACHKVLYCAELLEMILLNVYNPRDAFPIQPPAEIDTKEKQEVKQSDADEQEGGSVEQGRTQSDSRNEVLEEPYDEKEACRCMRTLLLSRRVNHMFKGMIDGSINLQQALWFFELFDSDAFEDDDDDEAGRRNRATANPLFSNFGTGPLTIYEFSHDSEHAECVMSVQIDQSVVEPGPDSEASARTDATWRRMLVLQFNQNVGYSVTVSGSAFCHGPVHMTDMSGRMTATDLLADAIEEEQAEYMYEIEEEMELLNDCCW